MACEAVRRPGRPPLRRPARAPRSGGPCKIDDKFSGRARVYFVSDSYSRRAPCGLRRAAGGARQLEANNYRLLLGVGAWRPRRRAQFVRAIGARTRAGAAATRARAYRTIVCSVRAQSYAARTSLLRRRCLLPTACYCLLPTSAAAAAAAAALSPCVEVRQGRQLTGEGADKRRRRATSARARPTFTSNSSALSSGAVGSSARSSNLDGAAAAAARARCKGESAPSYCAARASERASV